MKNDVHLQTNLRNALLSPTNMEEKVKAILLGSSIVCVEVGKCFLDVQIIGCIQVFYSLTVHCVASHLEFQLMF